MCKRSSLQFSDLLCCCYICTVEYEDMSKKQLMTAISKLERRLDRADADNTSLMFDMDDRRGKTEGANIYIHYLH